MRKATEIDVDKVIEATLNWWAEKIRAKGIAQQYIDEFAKLLSRQVSINLATVLNCELETDIAPLGILAEVALLSKVPSTAFPQKICMDITPNQIGLIERYSKRQVIFSV